MRIIGGTAGGRLLKVPPGYAVRPTPDLVKQAIFNSLGGRVGGARVLELFAGSGALSLECLSREAKSVVAVEKAARHAHVIRENLAAVGLPADRFEIRTQDVFAALPQLVAAGCEFDLVFADPPFGEKNLQRRSTSLSQRLLDDPSLPTLLSAEGLFILGHATRDALTLTERWRERRSLRHGDSMMRLLQKADPVDRPPSPASAASAG